MRRALLIILAAGLVGCALDLSDDAPDATGEDSAATDTTTSPEVTRRTRIGEACGIDEAAGCTPEAETWPDCLRGQCDGNVCVITYGNIGYCSTGCREVGDCVPSSGSVVGQAFQCLREGDLALCRAGSGTFCSSDFGCANQNVCTFGVRRIDEPLDLGGICQPPHEGGVAPGELCNDDPRQGPVVPCSKGLCIFGVCGELCSSSCSSPRLECVPELTLVQGYHANTCMPRPCSISGDCAEDGFECVSVQYETRTELVTEGRCLPPAN